MSEDSAPRPAQPPPEERPPREDSALLGEENRGESGDNLKGPGWRRRGKHASVIALVLVGFGALYTVNSWERDFWAPAETDFAAACREMGAADGSWLTPTIAGRPYLEKPPLIYWSGLFFERICRLEPHLAYRLPSALFAVLGLYVTYICGVTFFNRPVGLLAVVVQGTSYLWVRNAIWLQTDMMFSASIGLTLGSFGMVILFEPYAVRWKVLGYGGLALACLAKSPVLAAGFVGVSLLCFLFLHAGLRGIGQHLRQLRIGIGLAAVAAVVSPWYVWMGMNFENFLDVAFFEHHFGRLAGSESHGDHGYLAYFWILPLNYLPWSFFIPLSLFYGHAHFGRPAPKFFTIWLLVVFVTLTLISSKYEKYLLPLWMPLSLLVAAAFLETKRESIWERFLGAGLLRFFPWLLYTVASTMVIAAVLWALGVFTEQTGRPSIEALISETSFAIKGPVLLVLSGAGLAVAGYFAQRQMKRREVSRALFCVAAGFAVVYIAMSFSYRDLNAIKSGRAFCEKVDSTRGARPVAIYGTARPAIVYYLKYPLRTVLDDIDPYGKTPGREAALLEYLQAPEERLLLMYEKDRRKLEKDFPRFANLYRELDSGRVGSHRRYLILTNRVSGQ